MKDKTNKGYHKLLIWKRAYELALLVYKVTKDFPDSEKFGLVSQLRRAAISVVLNIIEGHRRSTRKDFLHYLNISSSSLAEVEGAIELSFGLGFISEETFILIDQKIAEEAYLLNSFSDSLHK